MRSSPADALVSLLRGKEGPSRITQTSPRIIRLSNGIKYYQVEVTSEDGAQYGISAYDDEAEELCRVAKSTTELILTA